MTQQMLQVQFMSIIIKNPNILETVHLSSERTLQKTNLQEWLLLELF